MLHSLNKTSVEFDSPLCILINSDNRLHSIIRKRKLHQLSQEQCILLIQSIYHELIKWVKIERKHKKDKDIIQNRAYTEAKGFLWGGGRLKWKGIDELFKLKLCKIKIKQKQYLYIMNHTKLSRRRHKFLFEWAGDLIDQIQDALPPTKSRKLQIISPQQMQAPRKLISNLTPIANQIEKQKDFESQHHSINHQHDIIIKSSSISNSSPYLNQSSTILSSRPRSDKHNMNDVTQFRNVIPTGLIILALDLCKYINLSIVCIVCII